MTIHAVFLWQFQFVISDAAVASLLNIFHHCIHLFRTVLGIQAPEDIYKEFPSSLYMARKLIGVDTEKFTKYVVCTE